MGEDDPVLRKFHYLDPGVVQYKKYALNSLLGEDKMALSMQEMQDLLEPRFTKVMIDTVVGEDQGVYLRIREWTKNDEEDAFRRTVACLNHWRSGELVRKEIIKRLIDGTLEEGDEWMIPLRVTYVTWEEGA